MMSKSTNVSNKVLPSSAMLTSTPIKSPSSSSSETIQLETRNSFDEAVYRCPKCPKTYNIAKSLRKHCRKNHNKLSICFCHHCPKVSLVLTPDISFTNSCFFRSLLLCLKETPMWTRNIPMLNQPHPLYHPPQHLLQRNPR